VLNAKIDDLKPFVEHLIELRFRIILTLTFFMCFFILSYFSTPYFIEVVKSSASHNEIQLNIFKITESVSIYVKVMLTQALAITLPILVMQIYLFSKPALNNQSRKLVLFTLPIVSILFSIGIYVALIFFVPLLTSFFINASVVLDVNTVYSFNDFFNFVFTICMIFGSILELPALIVFLTLLNIITPRTLQKSRRIVYPLLGLFSVTVTPPDFISDLIVMTLMFGLYELSILISFAFHKKKNITLNQRG
jgi:sec-independent protein translocase protein TatC